MAISADNDLNQLVEKIKNLLIRISFVKKIAKLLHQTGANQDPSLVQQIFAFYSQVGEVQGKTVLELGPGQTWQVADLLCAAGASCVYLCDIERYFANDVLTDNNIAFIQYAGKNLPLEDASVDYVCSYNVFEHLRSPETTINEVFRILKRGGKAIHSIDLRDHYFNLDSAKSFNCLRYSDDAWDAMTFHRSVYVNRLRVSEWIRLHLAAGFSISWTRGYENSLIRNIFNSGGVQYLSKFSDEDRFTCRLDLMVEKN